jgi:molecular chaperone DnaK (HSP70)
MAAVIAIDFGNENCLIALPQRRNVDIALNQSSQRVTPTMTGFIENRRYAGVFAQQQQMQDVKSTITNLKRLIGLRFDSPEREVIQSLVPYTIVGLEDGFSGVEVNYQGKRQVIRVEQCLAFLLKELFVIARRNSASTNECVIVVSPWWDESHRRAVLDAANIAGVKVLKLLNSTTAAAIAYSVFQRARLPESAEKAVYTAIVDFGDSAMNAAVLRLWVGNVEVKGFCSDSHLGGSHFTSALVNWLLEKTKTKYKIDPRSNPRAMLRFRQAAERLKKGLTVNPVMPFEVQNLMDVDVNFLVKREDFESTIVELVKRVRDPVERALTIAGVKKDELFAIEVHGGASRVPAVKSAIKDIFGREPTQTLNPDECFALGGGFQAAILSPQYKVDLNVTDVSEHRVWIEWYDETKGEQQTHELFKAFQVAPTVKRVPMKVRGRLEVLLRGDREEVGRVTVETGLEEVVTVKLQVKLTADGLIEVQSGFFIPPQPPEPEPEAGAQTTEAGSSPSPSASPSPSPSTSADPVGSGAGSEPTAEATGTGGGSASAGAGADGPAAKGESGTSAGGAPGEGPAPSGNGSATAGGTTAPPPPAPPKKPKPKEIPAVVTFVPRFGLSAAKVEELRKAEIEMAKADALEERIDETRNELESYIFQLQNGIERDFPEFFDPSKTEEYRRKLSEVSMWFSENEFDRLTIEEYNGQLKILKDIGEPALARRRTLQQLPTKVQELKDRASKARARLESTDEKYNHITADERAPLQKELSDFVSGVEADAKAAETKPKYLPISFDFGAAERKVSTIESRITTLLGKAKPPPPKPEPKPEDKAEDKDKDKKEGDVSGGSGSGAGAGAGSVPKTESGEAPGSGGTPRIEDVD